MSIPTPQELGELVYGVMREASGSIPFAPGLNALTERIGTSVRDAVLDGLAEEAHNELRFTTSMNCGAETSLAEWLRDHKADAQ